MKLNVIVMACLFFVSSFLATEVTAKGGGGKGGGKSGGSSHSSSKKSSGKRSSTKSTSGSHSTGKSSSTQVKGYTKKDGTYVAPHRRTTPDKTKQNNWSSKGNENPNTGKQGTKDPYPYK